MFVYEERKKKYILFFFYIFQLTSILVLVFSI